MSLILLHSLSVSSYLFVPMSSFYMIFSICATFIFQTRPNTKKKNRFVNWLSMHSSKQVLFTVIFILGLSSLVFISSAVVCSLLFSSFVNPSHPLRHTKHKAMQAINTNNMQFFLLILPIFILLLTRACLKNREIMYYFNKMAIAPM